MRAPLILHTRREFAWRFMGFALFGLGFLILALGIGVLGYRYFAGLSWIDSLFNAAMILTGMGPASAMPDDTAKLFASAYAIFGGAAYPAVTAIVIYPLLHRMLVALHLQSKAREEGE